MNVNTALDMLFKKRVGEVSFFGRVGGYLFTKYNDKAFSDYRIGYVPNGIASKYVELTGSSYPPDAYWLAIIMRGYKRCIKRGNNLAGYNKRDVNEILWFVEELVREEMFQGK